ncbi:hypothetical protein [Candidatus Neptunochlamydia vexilliferae]|uniref:Uncharacterized protein n=1 Tax=Candidatus Neptunichlamydia vexilliferae TaxID=1651774 RepID=A0ABS0AYD4_9BACT|nr:hypothetical protein [Candidatus Neptunochlamydia vexilliferae]MBF5059138.1 hypothetical protein [Candidatus Neptunochlamydia vexilliferae]
MSARQETTRLTVDLPNRAHKRVKTVSALLGITISDFVRESIEEKLNKKPNALTKKVLHDTDEKRHLKKFKNTKELFEDLGI